MKEFFKRKGIKGIIFSITFAIIYFILYISGAFNGLNNFFMDRIYQKPKATNNEIFIVAIDDKSLNELGKYDDWNRDYYATVINNLNTLNPAVIGVDIIFSGNSIVNPEYDTNLVNACNLKGNVVVASKISTSIKIDTLTLEKKLVVKEELPFESLNNVVGHGYTNPTIDSDNVIRKIIPNKKYNDVIYPSFSYEIYKRYCDVNGYDLNQYKNNQKYRINYTAYPGYGYTVVSFSDVYNGNIPSDIENGIVLIGAYSEELQDSLYTPIKAGKKMYGVEVHANIIDSYTRNDFSVDINFALALFIGLLLILLFAYIIYKSHILLSSILSVSLIGALFGLQSILFNLKIYSPFVGLMIIVAIIYVAYIGFKYGEELITRYKTVNVFKKYVAPQVVDKALKNVDYKVNVGGEKRHIACLFVDIRGFTPLSEGLEPEDVVSILNEYLSLTTNSIFAVGGTLDKFIGDATMAIFNAPFDLDDYEFKAIKAAWLIAKGSDEIDIIAYERFQKHVSFGIGVNSGYAVVGNIGSKSRIDYTAIGDTVNTAARLEANAKAREILISDEIYQHVKDRIEVEYVGDLSLKGKSKEVKTYRIINIKED